MREIKVNARINPDSLACLEGLKGKRLLRVGYVMDFDFSLASILVFDDVIIKVTCETGFTRYDGRYTEELAYLGFHETQALDDIPWRENGIREEYEYISYDMPVNGVDVVSDYIARYYPSTDERFVYDMQSVVILRSGEKNLLIHACSTTAESISFYESDAVLKDELALDQRNWEFLDENEEPLAGVLYRRTIEHL